MPDTAGGIIPSTFVPDDSFAEAFWVGAES